LDVRNGNSWSYSESSKNVQGGMAIYNPYWKRSESVDEEEDIIYELEYIWCDIESLYPKYYFKQST